MIRLASVLVPGDQPRSVFLPVGIEHPAFRPFKGGQSHYVLCWKPVVDALQDSGGPGTACRAFALIFMLVIGTYRRWKPENIRKHSMHPLVVQQIGHALRLRVIQELQILARQLRRRLRPRTPPVLRRLTRAEWDAIRSSGTIPFQNAVAVLVIPPVNRNPDTKQRPEPNYTSIPHIEDLQPAPKTFRETHPSSVLCPASQGTSWSLVDGSKLLPPVQAPLYHGATLFPSPTQRAALHAAVLQVLGAEHEARHRVRTQKIVSAGQDQGGRKGSHAVLICSDETTLLRGDTVPLAVALWRLRMWETAATDDSSS